MLNTWSCAGGGAIEMELSKYLRDHSRTIAGKEQLLIGCMAKALEVIPRQLCDNAGFDATNVLNKLRQKHAQGLICTPASFASVQSVVFIMTALCNRAGHYIFALRFLSFFPSIFFPRLISAVGDWMSSLSTILRHVVWP